MTDKSDAPGEQQVRVNIRFACWEQSRNPDQWVTMLARWLGPMGDEHPSQRDDRVRLAERVLSDQQALSKDQVKAVADALRRDVQDLYFENWPQMRPGLVIQENLKRLLAAPGTQTKAELAEELGVSPATLSRWISGSQVPDTSARRRIARLFRLRDSDELESSPIFLSYLPVTHGERVAWLNSRLRSMSWAELHELFPALLRIFSAESSQTNSMASKQRSLGRNIHSSPRR